MIKTIQFHQFVHRILFLNCCLLTCVLQMVKRLEKARKKAETVTDSVDISDKAKMKQVKE